jgi:hypothetical protein
MRKFARVSRYKSSVAEMARVEEVAANLHPEGAGDRGLRRRLVPGGSPLGALDVHLILGLRTFHAELRGGGQSHSKGDLGDGRPRILFIERYEIAYEM